MKKILLIGLFAILSMGKANAQENFIGEIKLFAGNFAPTGWLLCQGQLLSIAQNQALFAIIGTTYGGDGRTTFALPDLRGRVPVGFGQGPGMTYRNLGETFGSETVTLTVGQMPAHSHSVSAVNTAGNQNSPSGSFPADTKTLDKEYSNATPNATMNSSMVGTTGSNQPVGISQPSLGLNYIIATQGIFPPRQ